MAEYKIGDFTFESEEEYSKAQKEIKTIKLLKDKYNLEDQRTIKIIVDKFKPETIIGEKFIDKLKNKIEAEDENNLLLNAIDEELSNTKKEDDSSLPSTKNDNNVEPTIQTNRPITVVQSDSSPKDNNTNQQSILNSIRNGILYVVAFIAICSLVGLIEHLFDSSKKSNKNTVNEYSYQEPNDVDYEKLIEERDKANDEYEDFLDSLDEKDERNSSVDISTMDEMRAFTRDSSNIGKIVTIDATVGTIHGDRLDHYYLYTGHKDRQFFYGEGVINNLNLFEGDEIIFTGMYSGFNKTHADEPEFITINIELK